MRLKDNTRTPDCATAPAKKYPQPPIDRGTLECVAAYYEAKRDYGKKSHFRSRMSLVPNVPIPRNEYDAELWPRDLARLAKRLDSTLKHFKTLSEVADKIGLSYERYISHATEKCIEDFYYWEGHGGFPRPNQLYSEGVIEKMMDVAEQWQKIDKTTRNRETYENPQIRKAVDFILTTVFRATNLDAKKFDVIFNHAIERLSDDHKIYLTEMFVDFRERCIMHHAALAKIAATPPTLPKSSPEFDEYDSRKHCYGRGYQPPTFLRPRDYAIQKWANKFIIADDNPCDQCDLAVRCSKLTADRHQAEERAAQHGSADAAIASGEFTGRDLWALWRLVHDQRQDDRKRTVKRAEASRKGKKYYRKQHAEKIGAKEALNAEVDRRLASPPRKPSESLAAIKKRKQRAAKKGTPERKLSENPKTVKQRRWRGRKKLKAELPAFIVTIKKPAEPHHEDDPDVCLMEELFGPSMKIEVADDDEDDIADGEWTISGPSES